MKTIIVLGMHRSCTSLVAKGLHKSGDCFMGRHLLGALHGNKEGHFEDLAFITMNDLILKTAGGAWDDPPDERRIIHAGVALKSEIELLIRTSEKAPVWGWKDPRTTLTIRCYMPYLDNPVFVSCFRKPGDAALSLTQRDGTDFKRNLMLANEYNRRLIKFLAEQSNI